jgi:ankyrin repeat protein
MRAANSGHCECVKMLLQNGAQRDLRNASGKTAADLATAIGQNSIAKIINEFA